jgi:flagellar motor switch protein FliG
MPSEEFQELLQRVTKLSVIERAQLQEVMRSTVPLENESRSMSEAEFADYLASIGMVTRRRKQGPIPDYVPIRVPGRPLSEEIIEGRGPR